MLVLDAMRIMDTIWKSENLDLRMTPYRCVATGVDHGIEFSSLFAVARCSNENDKGMIEAVVPTATTAKIVAEHGGVLSAMRTTPLLSWLIDRARVRSFFVFSLLLASTLTLDACSKWLGVANTDFGSCREFLAIVRWLLCCDVRIRIAHCFFSRITRNHFLFLFQVRARK